MFDRQSGSRVFASAVAALIAAGCGGGEGGGSGDAEGGAPVETPVESPVDPTTAGNVSGTITFEGEPPAPEPIDMAAEPDCAAAYDSQPTTQAVLVGDAGGLANVFVYVREGLGDLQFPTPTSSVELDQQGCLYHPHVLGVQTGQTLTIRNSDGLLHNINAQPDANRGFNISQPVDMTSDRTFPVAEIMIPVECDVHGWMNAYIGVVEHPYYAVSAEDGSFDLSTLPPGDYVLEAWHERYGTATQNVTVVSGETADVQFTFSESMAAGAVVPLGEPLDLHEHHVVAAGD